MFTRLRPNIIGNRLLCPCRGRPMCLPALCMRYSIGRTHRFAPTLCVGQADPAPTLMAIVNCAPTLMKIVCFVKKNNHYYYCCSNYDYTCKKM